MVASCGRHCAIASMSPVSATTMENFFSELQDTEHKWILQNLTYCRREYPLGRPGACSRLNAPWPTRRSRSSPPGADHLHGPHGVVRLVLPGGRLHAWERGFGAGLWVVARCCISSSTRTWSTCAPRARATRARAEIQQPVRRLAPARRLGRGARVPAVDRLPDDVRAGAERHGQPRPGRARPVARAELASACSPAWC